MEIPATAGFWLSPQQKHVRSLQNDGRAYRSVCLLLIESDGSCDDMTSAVERLVARHEILRTIYVRQPGMTYPFQVVLEKAAAAIELLDWKGISETERPSKLNDLFVAAQVRSLGPEGMPVVTANVVALTTNRYAIVLSLPAMAADRSSLNILAQELEQVACGTHTASESEPVRYVQFSQWQNDLLEGTDGNAGEGFAFWNQHSGEDQLLPVPNERKQAGDFSPQLHACELDPNTLRQVRDLAAKENASEADVFLAAWQSLLWRLTGQPSFKVGVVFDGREYDELRAAIGLLAKTIPISARFDGDFRFREVVEHVRTTMSEAAAWQEYYAPEAGVGTEPSVVFEQAKSVDSSAIKRLFCSNDSYKLKLSVVQRSGNVALEFHYDGSRFSHDFIERVAGYFQRLLTAATAEPETEVSRLPLLDDDEKRKLIHDWNQTSVDYASDKTFHALFEAQAAKTPERLAVRFQEDVLTYQQLNERANQLARFLRESGVGSGSLVGLCAERSVNVMVALLAILKAGGAYVPLNPDNPKSRSSHQLSGVVALITEHPLLSNLPEFAGKTICLDRDAQVWANQSRENPLPNTNSGGIAYVIFTSGSTGVPKGVAVRHRNLVNYSCFIADRLRLSEFPDGLNFGTVSTIGADLGNTCIFPALISGGCVHVVSYDDSTDPQRFAQYLAKHPVDVLKIVPSHLQALLESSQAPQLLPRKYLILGGETLTPTLIRKIDSLGGSCEVLNHYGPTETTVGSLTLRLADYDWETSQAASIPIGRPIANTQVYILDALLQPVPPGSMGELYIAGEGVTAGYVNQPERTAERFLQNPFASDSTAQMYRTGDLARYLPDGNVEFLGRADDQIKIRGFRIELGEIESVITREPAVRQALVIARDDARGEKRLVAYVVADQSQNGTADQIRTRLKEQLPDYMIPSAIVYLAKIPLTANGKVDRQALPEPEAVATKFYVAPKTATEEALAKIWSEVLRRDHISADDNFFDLGGHSLLATQVVSRIREQFLIDLPIRALFESPTVCGLAEGIANSTKTLPQTQEPAIVRVSREAYRATRS
jgi:amino acid adenylation domain-containing protein